MEMNLNLDHKLPKIYNAQSKASTTVQMTSSNYYSLFERKTEYSMRCIYKSNGYKHNVQSLIQSCIHADFCLKYDIKNLLKTYQLLKMRPLHYLKQWQQIIQSHIIISQIKIILSYTTAKIYRLTNYSLLQSTCIISQ
jgi:hypothetical protein